MVGIAMPKLRKRFTLRFGATLSALTSLIATGVLQPAGTGHPSVEGRVVSLDGLQAPGVRKVVAAPIEADMIGFDWKGAVAATLRVRVQTPSGWTRWFEADGNPDEAPDDAPGQKSSRTVSAPVWIGRNATNKVEVEAVSGQLEDLHMHLIKSLAVSPDPWSVKSAAALPAQPAIITRAEWGADESWRTCGPDYADGVRYSVVHHTATGNDYSPDEAASVVRSIYYYHTHTNGWCDIGYNFLIDRYGRVYEGRYGGIDRPVIGAHAKGFNTGSTGASLIGNFENSSLPEAARSALERLLAWKLDLHGVNARSQIQVTSGDSSKYPEGTVVTLWTISGHRDVSLTACPGDFPYNLLPSLRNDVQRDIDASHWERLSPAGMLGAGADAASWGSGRLDVFGRGADSSVVHEWFAGSWAGPESLGGVATSDPTAVSWGPDRIDVFVRGTDDSLWHRWWEGSWYPWERLGGVLASGPDVASWTSHLSYQVAGQDPLSVARRLDVFAKGPDGSLMHKWYDGLAWSGWESLGGVITSDPSAVSWGLGRIDVFARGTDNQLWHKWFDGTAWGEWEPLGGALASAPDASSWDKGRLDVFAQGTDGGIWHKWFDGTWSDWQPLGGPVTPGGDGANGDPSAAGWGPGRIDLFVPGKDGALYHRWYDGGAWDR
jgi:hypothetical protein